METHKTPLFKSLDDEALRREYWSARELAYNNAAMASAGFPRGRLAYQMAQLMRNIEIIEAIANQRKIRLVVANG